MARKTLPNAVTVSAGALEPIAVTIPDGCRIAGLSRTSIYREINAGRIKAVKAGRRTLLPVESLRAWLASLSQSNAAYATRLLSRHRIASERLVMTSERGAKRITVT